MNRSGDRARAAVTDPTRRRGILHRANASSPSTKLWQTLARPHGGDGVPARRPPDLATRLAGWGPLDERLPEVDEGLCALDSGADRTDADMKRRLERAGISSGRRLFSSRNKMVSTAAAGRKTRWLSRATASPRTDSRATRGSPAAMLRRRANATTSNRASTTGDSHRWLRRGCRDPRPDPASRRPRRQARERPETCQDKGKAA
jgi:hypothetical protein